MAEITQNVNWLAVAVGFVVAYGFGWIWYGPLFGKAWSTGLGISMPDSPPVPAMAVQAIGTFLLAWVIGVTAASDALMTAILIVATIVVLAISGSLYAQKPGKVIAIDAGYVVAMAVIMVVVQGIF